MKSRGFTILLTLTLVVVAMLFANDADAQCAMCKLNVKSSGAGATDDLESFGKGLNNGIIYMMIFPYIIFFLVFRKRAVRLFKELRSTP